MLPLRELQALVAAALLDPDRTGRMTAWVSEVDCLNIYRNTMRSSLTGALRLTYPATERVVGEAFFEGAAAAFVGAHPPRSAWLDQYGGDFATFLAGFEPARSLAYLPDLARLEWAVAAANGAVDGPRLDPALLTGDERLIPHPSLRLVTLDWPVDQVWDALQREDDAALSAIVMVSSPHALLIHRGIAGVMIRPLDPPERRFTEALLAGACLDRALEDEPAIALLAEHFATGRFSGATSSAKDASP